MLWKKISDCIDKVVDIIGSVAVLVTILSTSFNIFSRWFVGRSFGQLDEISLIAFVWTIYIGMGVLYNKNEHICMDFILNKLEVFTNPLLKKFLKQSQELMSAGDIEGLKKCITK